MSWSIDVIFIIIFLTPGIIATLIFERLTGKDKRKDWKDFVLVIVFSLMAYMIYVLIQFYIYKIDINNTILNKIDLNNTDLMEMPWFDIIIVSVISIIIGYIASYFETYKLLNRFSKFIKSTNTYDDKDLWDYFFNSDLRKEWIFIRDHSNNLIYYCYVLKHSETNKERELILTNVDVYDNNTNFLYHTDVMYLSRDKYKLTIEILYYKEEKE